MNTMRIKIGATFLIFLVSIAVIVLLYASSTKDNLVKNGFNRSFQNQEIVSLDSIQLNHSGYYFAGATDHHIYLGNHQSPKEIFVTDYSLVDTTRIKLSIFDTSKIAWGATNVKIDSPNIVMYEGATPSILHGSLPTSNIIRYANSGTKFNRAVPISSFSIVLRTYNRQLNQNILKRENIDSPLIKHSYQLEKQIDGFFCTDGMLLYSNTQNQIFYIFYYRNQIICLDTNLNIIYQAKTIDTISHARIKVGTIHSKSSVTLSSPPLLVNKKGLAVGKYIFVNSVLLADNESKETFKHYSAIDVYLAKDGSYQFSFYIPLFQNRKITDFYIKNNFLFVLYNQNLHLFKLNFSIN